LEKYFAEGKALRLWRLNFMRQLSKRIYSGAEIWRFLGVARIGVKALGHCRECAIYDYDIQSGPLLEASKEKMI
jgi:hypothetical protein